MSSSWKILLLLIVAFALLACSDSNNHDNGTSGNAPVRVQKPSPYSPNGDVLVDNVGVASNVPYGSSSAYLTTGAGSRNIRVRQTGTTTDLLNQNVSLANNSDTTLMVGNTA